MFNLPNLLTWQRMLAIPLLVAVYLLPWEGWSIHSRNLVATILFVAAAVTDWFDGWLARRLGQQTAFGAFLDPVADKLLVCVALVMLLDLQRVAAGIAAVIIGREIAISALREWMATIGARRSVAVNWVGKLKTVSQLVAIPLLLYHDRLFGWIDSQRLGTWLINIAAILTLWSMGYYLKQAWPQLRTGRTRSGGSSA
ncbi:MAG: CDP-diacylglycerol--glycerol-3-phosphate 3-phosphatidyltransferase [Lautropia sp.]